MPGPLRLLSVGSIVPRKGYDVLICALATLADLAWHLTIVGDARDARNCQHNSMLKLPARDCRSACGSSAPFRPNACSDFYANADVFVLASRFEGYGMAFAEAVAAGLPVIGTTAGAIRRGGSRGAGILVPPDDVDALARRAPDYHH